MEDATSGNPPPDAALLEAVRQQDPDAYGDLFQRHLPAARHHAGHIARRPADADDLVAEAFTKVFAQLRAGNGPDRAFRAYLLTTMRHTAVDGDRHDAKLELSGDITTLDQIVLPRHDNLADGGDHVSLARQALRRLPDRWQEILSYIVIEDMNPAAVASLMRLTPNGAAQLAVRAQRGLRSAYLQLLLSQPSTSRPCKWTTRTLRSSVARHQDRRLATLLATHIDQCPDCRAHVDELLWQTGSWQNLRRAGAWVVPGPHHGAGPG